MAFKDIQEAFKSFQRRSMASKGIHFHFLILKECYGIDPKAFLQNEQRNTSKINKRGRGPNKVRGGRGKVKLITGGRFIWCKRVGKFSPSSRSGF